MKKIQIQEIPVTMFLKTETKVIMITAKSPIITKSIVACRILVIIGDLMVTTMTSVSDLKTSPQESFEFLNSKTSNLVPSPKTFTPYFSISCSRFENSRDTGGDVFENGNGSHNGHHQITNNHQNSAGNNGYGEFGEIDCPVVPGFQSPIKGDDLAPFCGRNRGIQVIY